MTIHNSYSQSGVKSPPALEQSPRPASTTDPVEKSIESFAKDSGSNIVNQDIKYYLTEAYQIIKQAENNQKDSLYYSYACYKQAIIIMLSITKGFDNTNLGTFSVQDEPSHLFGKLLDHYSLQDTQSKNICMGVFHVARDMIENTNSDAKSACTDYRCMDSRCSNDKTIRNEILNKFLKKDSMLNSEDRELNDALESLFNQGLGCVLNDSPPPPAPHKAPRPPRRPKITATPAAPPELRQALKQQAQAPTEQPDEAPTQQAQAQQTQAPVQAAPTQAPTPARVPGDGPATTQAPTPAQEPVETPEERYSSWCAAIFNDILNFLRWLFGTSEPSPVAQNS